MTAGSPLKLIAVRLDLIFGILLEVFPEQTSNALDRLLDEKKAEYGEQLLAGLDLDFLEGGDDD